MIVNAKFNALILTNYWIFSFSQFYFVSGVRPHCKGNPLKPEEFSEEGEVGFVRDLTVDIIARNIFDELNLPASSLCENLASIQTLSCFCKCTRWKRSNPRRNKTTDQIMTMATELITNFNEAILTDVSLDDVDKDFILGRIYFAEDQLIISGVVTKNSKLISEIEYLKDYFYDPNSSALTKLEASLAIRCFISNFETEEKVEILRTQLAGDVVEKFTMSGILRLIFEYRKEELTTAKTAILKIPSLAETFQYFKDAIIYRREAHLYEVILPALFKLGKCEPFSAKLYAATPAGTLIVEDLSVEGYEHCRTQSGTADLAHSMKALSLLAKYHALSYAYLSRLNPLDPSISFIESDQAIYRLLEEQFDAVLQVIEPFIGTESSAYQKILAQKNDLLAGLPIKNRSNQNSMNVIIHGDFHLKNTLFKYDTNGDISQVKLIDWQFSRMASPVIDLTGFLIEDIKIEVFETEEDTLLNHYLNSLNHNLSSLSANRSYSRSELDEDIKLFKYHYFRVLATFALQALHLDSLQRQSIHLNIKNAALYLERKGFI